MQTAKRKISVSLDEDLVAELGKSGGTFSAQVNAAVRETLAHQSRQRRLGEFLDALEAEEGPVDETLIERIKRLLE